MRKNQSAERPGPEQGCKVEVCENPDTGDWYVKSSGPCSAGYLRRFKQIATSRGILFPPEADEPRPAEDR